MIMRTIGHAGFLRALLLCLVSAGPAFAADRDLCHVDDPTGTPLNVRSAPNGTILTTLESGTRVEMLEERRLGTKRWFLIARGGEELGWAFAPFIVCPRQCDAREAAPGQPAVQR
jgi:hypothetical protein